MLVAVADSGFQSLAESEGYHMYVVWIICRTCAKYNNTFYLARGPVHVHGTRYEDWVWVRLVNTRERTITAQGGRKRPVPPGQTTEQSNDKRLATE